MSINSNPLSIRSTLGKNVTFCMRLNSEMQRGESRGKGPQKTLDLKISGRASTIIPSKSIFGTRKRARDGFSAIPRPSFFPFPAFRPMIERFADFDRGFARRFNPVFCVRFSASFTRILSYNPGYSAALALYEDSAQPARLLFPSGIGVHALQKRCKQPQDALSDPERRRSAASVFFRHLAAYWKRFVKIFLDLTHSAASV